jgi:hypothetical protein
LAIPDSVFIEVRPAGQEPAQIRAQSGNPNQQQQEEPQLSAVANHTPNEDALYQNFDPANHADSQSINGTPTVRHLYQRQQLILHNFTKWRQFQKL